MIRVEGSEVIEYIYPLDTSLLNGLACDVLVALGLDMRVNFGGAVQIERELRG